MRASSPRPNLLDDQMGACSLSGFDAETGWLAPRFEQGRGSDPLAECSAFFWKRTAGVAGAKIQRRVVRFTIGSCRTPSRAETHSKGNLKTNMKWQMAALQRTAGALTSDSDRDRGQRPDMDDMPTLSALDLSRSRDPRKMRQTIHPAVLAMALGTRRVGRLSSARVSKAPHGHGPVKRYSGPKADAG